MEQYQEFKKELSVYENASKTKIKFVILIHQIFRCLFTKTFDFIVSMLLIVTVPFLITEFSINVLFVCILIHFLYWATFYTVMSKKFESNDYEIFTMRIEILKEILSKK